MARVLGVNLPHSKRVLVALQSIYGIGPSRSFEICQRLGFSDSMRVYDLTDSHMAEITDLLENDYVVEGRLRQEVASSIKRLMDIGCYRGLRHRVGLPVRGQRTKSNARTRRGRARPSSVGSKKK